MLDNATLCTDRGMAVSTVLPRWSLAKAATGLKKADHRIHLLLVGKILSVHSTNPMQAKLKLLSFFANLFPPGVPLLLLFDSDPSIISVFICIFCAVEVGWNDRYIYLSVTGSYMK